MSIDAITAKFRDLQVSQKGEDKSKNGVTAGATSSTVASTAVSNNSLIDKNHPNRCLKRLQEAALLGPSYNVLDEKALGAQAPVTSETKKAVDETLTSLLEFPFQATRLSAGYTLQIPYARLIQLFKWARESFFPQVNSVSIVGSAASQYAGSTWHKSSLEILASHPKFAEKLHGLASSIAKLDLSHIDCDADDIDTYVDAQIPQQAPQIDAKNAPDWSVRMELVLMQELIEQHFRLTSIRVFYNNASYLDFSSFGAFVQHLCNPLNRGNGFAFIHTAQVLSSHIPWLEERKISANELLEMTKVLDAAATSRDQPDFTVTTIHLACKYLFRLSYEEMSAYIYYQANPFIHFHSVFKKGADNDKSKPLKDWFRISCKDARGEIHDLLLIRQNRSCAQRFSFQNLQLQLLNAKQKLTSNIKITASWQAIIDKAFRLLRFVDLKNADHKDWAHATLHFAKGYVSVTEGASTTLQARLLDYLRPKSPKTQVMALTTTSQGRSPDKAEAPAPSIALLLQERITKRSKFNPTLNFVYLFNALNSISPQELSTATIAKTVEELIPQFCSIPSESGWGQVATLLINKTVSYQTLKIYLKRLAIMQLLFPLEKETAKFRLQVTEHEAKYALQLEMDGHYFLFEMQIEKDLQEYAECLLTLTDKEKEALVNLEEKLLGTRPYVPRAHAQDFVSNLDQLYLVAHKLLDSDFSLGCRLFLMVDSLPLMLRHAASFVQNKKEPQARECVLQRIKDGLQALPATVAESSKQRLILAIEELNDTTHKQEQYIQALFRLQDPALCQEAFSLFKQSSHSTYQRCAWGFQLVMRLMATDLPATFKLLTYLREQNGGTKSDWAGLCKSLVPCVVSEKEEARFVLNYSRLSEVIQWCLERQYLTPTDTERYLAHQILELFENDKPYRAILIASSYGYESVRPIANSYLEIMGSRTNAEQAIEPTFVAVSPTASLLEQELYVRISLEYASVVQKMHPQLQPFARRHLTEQVIKAPTIARSEQLLEEIQRLNVVSEVSLVWLSFCEQRLSLNSPAATFEAYQMGSRLTLCARIKPAEYPEFHAKLIASLFGSTDESHRALGDQLFGQVNGEVTPLLEASIVALGNRRKQQQELERLLQATTKEDFYKKLDTILARTEQNDAVEVARVRKFVHEMLIRTQAQSQPYVEALKKSKLQSLFVASPAQFLQLLLRVAPEQMVEISLAFLKRAPLACSDASSLKMLDSLIKAAKHVTKAVDLLEKMQCRDLALWQAVVTECAALAPARVREAGSALLRNPQLLATIQTEQELAAWQTLHTAVTALIVKEATSDPEGQQKLFSTLTSRIADASALTERFSWRSLDLEMHCHLLQNMFTFYNARSLTPSSELEQLLIETRKKISSALNLEPQKKLKSSLDLLCVKVMLATNDSAIFSYITQLLHTVLTELHTPEEITPDHVQTFFSLVSRANSLNRSNADEINSTIEKTLAYYTEHLRSKCDPMMLIISLIMMPKKPFLRYAASIALDRLKKRYPCDPKATETLGQPDTLFYAHLVDVLCNTPNSEYIEMARQFSKQRYLREYAGQIEFHLQTSSVVLNMTSPRHTVQLAHEAVLFITHVKDRHFTASEEHYAGHDTVGRLQSTPHGQWIAKRRDAVSTTNFSIEEALRAFYCVSCEFLALNFDACTAFPIEYAEDSFSKLILDAIDPAAQQIIACLSNEENRNNLLKAMIRKLIIVKYHDPKVKRVFVCYTWALLRQLLRKDSVPAQQKIELIHLFVNDPLSSAEGASHIHHTLCKTLFTEALSNGIFEGKTEDSFKLQAVIYGNLPLLIPVHNKRATLKPLLEDAIKILTRRKNVTAIYRAFALLETYSLAFFSHQETLVAVENLLSCICQTPATIEEEVVEYFKMLQAMLPMLQYAEAKLTAEADAPLRQKCHAIWLSAMNTWLRAAEQTDDALIALFIANGLKLLKPNSESANYLATGELYFTTLSCWMRKTKALSKPSEQSLACYVPLTHHVLESHAHIQNDPSTRALWVNQLTEWYLFLEESKELTTKTCLNWLNRGLKALDPTLRGLIANRIELSPLPYLTDPATDQTFQAHLLKCKST